MIECLSLVHNMSLSYVTQCGMDYRVRVHHRATGVHRVHCAQYLQRVCVQCEYNRVVQSFVMPHVSVWSCLALLFEFFWTCAMGIAVKKTSSLYYRLLCIWKKGGKCYFWKEYPGVAALLHRIVSWGKSWGLSSQQLHGTTWCGTR